MTEKKEMTFEDSLKELEAIVKHLEGGEVPLEEALDEFERGINLSKQLKKKLKDADDRLTKIIDEEDQESDFSKQVMEEDQ